LLQLSSDQVYLHDSFSVGPKFKPNLELSWNF
jgi:hypothetical protein